MHLPPSVSAQLSMLPLADGGGGKWWCGERCKRRVQRTVEIAARCYMTSAQKAYAWVLELHHNHDLGSSTSFQNCPRTGKHHFFALHWNNFDAALHTSEAESHVLEVLKNIIAFKDMLVDPR